MTPKQVERLEKTLGRVAREQGLDQERLRRWVSFLVLCGVLESAVEKGVIDIYYLKGGVAMELRFARAARTTKDFDLGLRGNRAERIRRLSEVLQLRFDEFTFRLKPEQHEMELADTVPVEVAVEYKTRAWQTIEVDLGPGEAREVDLVTPAIEGVAEMGLPITNQVRCLGINEQVAQKLHACTESSKTRARTRLRPKIFHGTLQIDFIRSRTGTSCCLRRPNALRDHPERLIALKSSARCRHLDESTDRAVRYYRCEISLRGNVESRRCAIERNGGSASESLAQNFNGLSNFCGGGNEPDERHETDAERVERPKIIAAAPCRDAIKSSVRMLRQRRPRGSTRRTIEAVQSVRVSTSRRNGVNRPVVVGSPVDGGPVQKSVRALNQSREWFSALSIRVEVVEIGESSSRSHLKDDAVAIHAAVDSRAIEIAIAGLHQWGIRFSAVSTVEHMYES